MVENGMDVRRENALVGFVDMDGRIGPPEESLWDFGPVIYYTFDLEISAAGL